MTGLTSARGLVAADCVFRLGQGADLRGVQQSHFPVSEQQQVEEAV